jgi:hypothetical protein
MSDSSDLILQRLKELQEGQNTLSEKVDDGFAQMNSRVRKAETELTRIKTVWATVTGLAAAVGALIAAAFGFSR